MPRITRRCMSSCSGAADIVMPPTLRSYGMRQMEVRDLDGYVLCFGEDVPASKPA
ncbi:MAG TPA: hypothetical protein VMB84_10855 [Stellaceae bacterium]|nr:hypothetical protein [Stellaceae bacterium]